jgi:hypothetical protein
MGLLQRSVQRFIPSNYWYIKVPGFRKGCLPNFANAIELELTAENFEEKEFT